MSRGNNRRTFINSDPLYRDYLRDRQVGFIRQYTYPFLAYPTPEQIRNLNLITHIWTQGDRFYKLAMTHYSSYRHWWIVPWFNQKPLESDYKLGEVIYIPKPLETILSYT